MEAKSGSEEKYDLKGEFDGFEDDESDGRTINVAIASESSSPHHFTGMNLDLSFADAKKSFVERVGVQEQSILVIFDLPDGSQGESHFKLGQTVEVLKGFIECEYGIPMNQQTLYLEEKIMLDPLSLLDFSDAKGCEEIYVRVEGILPRECKK